MESDCESMIIGIVAIDLSPRVSSPVERDDDLKVGVRKKRRQTLQARFLAWTTTVALRRQLILEPVMGASVRA